MSAMSRNARDARCHNQSVISTHRLACVRQSHNYCTATVGYYYLLEGKSQHGIPHSPWCNFDYLPVSTLCVGLSITSYRGLLV